jgi:hypothetical protein
VVEGEHRSDRPFVANPTTDTVHLKRKTPTVLFTGLWFDSIWLPSEKYKIMSWKKKEFEDLEDLVVSFRLYFVIAGDSLCISTMYYLLL